MKVLLVCKGDGHIGSGCRSLKRGMNQGLPDESLIVGRIPHCPHVLQILDVVGRVLVVLHNLLNDLIIHGGRAILCTLAE